MSGMSDGLLKRLIEECASEATRVLDAGGSIPCDGNDILGIVPDHIRQRLEQEDHNVVVDLAMAMLRKIIAQNYKLEDLESELVHMSEYD